MIDSKAAGSQVTTPLKMLSRPVILARCSPWKKLSTRSYHSPARRNTTISALGVSHPSSNGHRDDWQHYRHRRQEQCCTHRRFLSSVPDKVVAALEPLRDPSLRGVGQVIFLNSTRSGAILVGSLALGDPFVACMAAAGSLASTLASQQFFSTSRRQAIADGLHSYNGSLVGCATAVFVAPESTLAALAVTLVGAPASTLVSAGLTNTLKIPQWTYAFNIVTLTMLLRLQPLREASSAAATAGTTTFLDTIASPLKGLSQIFVIESSLTGLGVAAAIASYSPMLAGHALMGSTIGSLTGWALLSATTADVAAGLWGFNSALTSIGVGVFFVHSRATVAVSAGGAFATACCFGALQTVFGMAHAPCLTLPFCLTMSACYQLHPSIQGLTLAKNPQSPERNTSYV